MRRSRMFLWILLLYRPSFLFLQFPFLPSNLTFPAAEPFVFSLIRDNSATVFAICSGKSLTVDSVFQLRLLILIHGTHHRCVLAIGHSRIRCSLHPGASVAPSRPVQLGCRFFHLAYPTFSCSHVFFPLSWKCPQKKSFSTKCAGIFGQKHFSPLLPCPLKL